MGVSDGIEIEGDRSGEEKDLTAKEVLERYADADEGLLIQAKDLVSGQMSAAYLGPDGDYVIFTGPDYHVAHESVFPTSGTTQLTIKKVD